MSGCQGALLEMCVHRSHDGQLTQVLTTERRVGAKMTWTFSVCQICRPYKTHFFKETTGVGHTQDSFMVDIHLTLVLKWNNDFILGRITTTVTIFRSSCTSVTLLLNRHTMTVWQLTKTTDYINKRGAGEGQDQRVLSVIKWIHVSEKVFFVILTVMEENKWISNEIFNIFNHW